MTTHLAKGNIMSRKFIATIVAAALTVTAVSSAPARADDDFVKLIIGAAALYAITQSVRSDKPRVSTTSPHRPPVVKPRPLPEPVRRANLLPANCLKYHQTRHGTVRMMGERCLTRHYRHVNRLPKACKTQARTIDGMRYGYEPRCLRHKGFKLAQY